MGSGFAGIASVDIANGRVTFREAWGSWTPADGEHNIELDIEYTKVPGSAGNVHFDPVEVRHQLYLTIEQLEELANQLDIWKTSNEVGGWVGPASVGG